MSIFENEDFLPGVVTEIESSYASDYDTSLWGTTDSAVVIGSAFDGPTGQLTPVYSVKHAAYLFGKSYDSKTRREVDLVAGVQDLWDNGCRTIYCMRYNGIDMYKDFKFCTNVNYKLRVKSRYPSNLGKQVYLKYDNTPGAETITIYKPASRSTIKEKINGLVESDTSVMVNEINLANDYSLNGNSKLVDVLSIINEHAYNNVVELSIVDKDGNDVTDSTDAYDITLGCVFPGTYFMGRAKSLCTKHTLVETRIVNDNQTVKPYSDFDGDYYQVLKINTDVAKDLPIYAATDNDLESAFAGLITLKNGYDYLADAEISNKAFPEDAIDYEETDLTPFEIYKKLGEGFVTTAVAEKRANGVVPKVKEADLNDVQRIQPLGDGVYSILQDVKVKYHVPGAKICADQVIGGKLPKAEEFKTTIAKSADLLKKLVSAMPNVSETNTKHPKQYKFTIASTTSDAVKTDIEAAKVGIETAPVLTDIGFVTKVDDVAKVVDATDGELFVLEDDAAPVLYQVNAKGKAEICTNTDFKDQLFLANGKAYKATVADNALKLAKATSADVNSHASVLISSIDKLFVGKFADGVVTPLCEYSTLANYNADEKKMTLFVFAESNEIGENVVSIKSDVFEILPINDFVEDLNAGVLNTLFTFSLTTAGSVERNSYVNDNLDGADIALAEDRVRDYDLSLHIPYCTTDNFARQLAQHCTYTELKTGTARGVIGCKRVTDISKGALAKKVSELKSKDWQLYAKNSQGRNMLDSNNLPYPIGRNVSVTFFQNRVTTPSDYVQVLNGATAYAGMISCLPLEKSSTAQTIDIVPMFTLTHTQLSSLTNAGFVTVRPSSTQGYIITDGITMAPADDNLKRLFNTRVIGYVDELLRAVCEPYIGSGNTTANRNSLSTAIDSKLSALLDVLLLGYEFKVVEDTTSETLTYIDINYTIRPVNEIRNIYNHIRVAK